MNRETDPLLYALRSIRAVDPDERDLGKRLLEVVMAATASTAATLRRPLAGTEEIRVGADDDGGDGDVARLERSFATRSGLAVLSLARPAGASFDAADATMLETLGGECVLRIEQARADVEATRLRHQVELLRALSRTGEGAPRPLVTIADRAASELLRVFAGAHVIIHVLAEDHLELIARRTEVGNDLADAPDWARRIPLDGSTAMAIAAREGRTVSRSVNEVAPPRRVDLEAWGIRHIVVVPLALHDVVVGTLMVAHRKDEPWEDDALRFLESVAAQVGVELANARVLEAERRRAEDLGLVNELGRLMTQHLELRAVLSTAVTELARVLQVARVHVCLVDETKVHLKGVSFAGDSVADLDLPLASSHATEESFRTLAPVIVEDAATDNRTNKELVTKAGTRSLLAVPLVARGGAIGVIVLSETRHKRRFTASEVARVVAVANVIAPAVTNAKMFEDLRRSYEALAKAQADLVTHERFAALGELSAVIAHEVRNPVAIIFNSLSELRRLALPVPEASLMLGIISEETTRLNRIVGDLLDFARPYHVNPRLVHLDAVVAGAVEAARRAAPEPRIEVTTEVRLPGRELVLDGTMLQQALLNLIVNAIQATPKGKAVTVRADVTTEEGHASLRCEVADEGTGIDGAASARMFQPFFTTKATGTGLGLAVVRRLVTALGGTVVAQTRPTGGALFRITVPLSGDAVEG